MDIIGGVFKMFFEGLAGFVSYLNGDSLLLYRVLRWKPLVMTSFALSFVLAIWAIYSFLKFKEIEAEEMRNMPGAVSEDGVAGDVVGVGDWVAIYEMLNSDSPRDWVRAVYASEAKLDNLLDRLGLKGLGLEEKLKGLRGGRGYATVKLREIAMKKRQLMDEFNGGFAAVDDFRKVVDGYKSIEDYLSFGA